MQKKSISSVNRAALLGLGVVIILFVSLFLALFFRSRQLASLPESTVEMIPTSDVGRLEMVDGQQMSSSSYTLSTDVDAPAPLLLPLRTIADFDASDSARTARITTSAGTLTVELYPDQAPLTVANFVTLARAGFYDDLRFHRVEPGFVVQVGDPASRGIDDMSVLRTLGTGYPGYRIADEFDPTLSHDAAGVLSMANINADGSFPDSGGSQFFITLAPVTYLDGRHAVFGRVIEGLDVLDKIQVGDVIKAITFDDASAN